MGKEVRREEKERVEVTMVEPDVVLLVVIAVMERESPDTDKQETWIVEKL